MKNRAQILKNYLIDNYDIKISKYEKIKYSPLPIPKIELKMYLQIGKSLFK